MYTLDPNSYEFRVSLDRWLTTPPREMEPKMTACPCCEGKGFEVVADDDGETWWEPCFDCDGTGEVVEGGQENYEF